MLVLVALGPVEERFLYALSSELERRLRTECVVEEIIEPLPPETYCPQRGAYEAKSILKLIPPLESEGDVLLLVTEADLYAEQLAYVFGEAAVGGGQAIMSLARLSGSMDDPVSLDSPESHSNRQTLLTRATKVALHETGHALGLDHCGFRGCVMQLCSRVEEVDRQDAVFCSECRKGVVHTENGAGRGL